MVIYEVNLAFDASIEERYRAWLAGHVRRMLELPGFVAADVLDVLDDGSDVQICVQYRLQDQTALDNYFQVYAPAMRTETQASFGEQIRAQRRVLAPFVTLISPNPQIS